MVWQVLVCAVAGDGVAGAPWQYSCHNCGSQIRHHFGRWCKWLVIMTYKNAPRLFAHVETCVINARSKIVRLWTLGNSALTLIKYTLGLIVDVTLLLNRDYFGVSLRCTQRNFESKRCEFVYVRNVYSTASLNHWLARRLVINGNLKKWLTASKCSCDIRQLVKSFC